MATPHIEVEDKNLFAKTVLMPGDPLRAEYIAKNYLTDVIMINKVRNMFGYTGYYKGKKITVMGSGMGMPSIGIYSYELYNNYDVDKIIRVGSCGAYSPDAKLYDIIIVKDAYSESSFAKTAYNYQENIISSDDFLTNNLSEAAKNLNIPFTISTIHSSDVFYRAHGNVMVDVRDKYNCVGVEMESFALFANAKYLNKKAACILTVSDSLVTKEYTTAEERQKSFNKMMEIALEAA
ncbi:MAG: purine-nucleoside phosphorylase [Bacilli bacterium]|jgi:purine-nucleoside phosphorylase|nr:purine-nucleoside phosphorylase [Bacilli bacterium]MDD4063484.1 purine-nucleoside phosphorylase [Bacilli bacterium]MDD4481978.1 purine-nucleoside phosphorylase [Bacilli bacterium]MDD5182868.1 purine-nucleoside phosphorylase [Bacilli bacterium]